MTRSIADFTKTSSAALTAEELLQQSPAVLLGVGSDAATELAKLGVTTVFDLASSSVFATARKIAFAADSSSGDFAPGGIAGDFIDTTARTIDLAELPLKSIEVLRAIDPTLAQSLSTALGVTNIREFALWPPYEAARFILSRAYGLDAAAADPEAPTELVPGARPYPTERVQYEVLVLDELDTHGSSPAPMLGARPRPGPASTGKPLEEAGQLDLAAIATETTGFTRPAFGALLTYTQSWFPEGLALGQLLHTLALAPGESTRVALVDWSRRTFATTSENISEGEALTADMERIRSIGEIVNAVATEAQQGFSESFGVGGGTSVGTASGGAGSADLSSLAGLPLKVAGGSGESTGMGIGAGYARSSSWTTGQRNLSANMAQKIQDRTHQESTLTRNRRATIVREVSQAESERVSTRTVTNYNHMHALSIEYYEVVQLYRVTVDLARVSAALFVPMKLIDFSKPGVVARYKQVLAASGLTPRVRALAQAEPDRIVLFARRATLWDPEDLSRMLGERVGERTSASLVLPLNFYPLRITLSAQDGSQPFGGLVFEYQDGHVEGIAPSDILQGIGPVSFDLSSKFVPALVRPDSTQFWDVVQIRLQRDPNHPDWSGDVEISLELYSMMREGFPRPQGSLQGALKFTTYVTPAPTAQREPVVFEFSRTVSGKELYGHLMDNQLYYSQRVWATLDSTTVAQLLSGYTFRGKPVLSDVDPLPITVAGNFLVFRKHEPVDAAGQAQWAQWLATRDIVVGERKTDLVPLPSGGVFAEAVLGRFNSAEKLDITRFWNWQDSPIPITPPEIAAIQTGSRAQAESLLPGQLSQPTLKVELPPNLPDPQGLAAILQAIQNGNMFRDMSGLNATIGFAQNALSRAFDAARDAAAQAGENMKTAADIYKSAFGGQGSTMPGGTTRPSSTGATRNPSETGALINQGRDMDKRGLMPSSNGSTPQGAGQGATASSSQASTANESAAFNSAVGPGGESIQLVKGPSIVRGANQLTEGIDVSHFAGTINWNLVSYSGIRFAFLRASYGIGPNKGSADEKWFIDNWDAVQSVSIIRGVYHFFRPSQDAKQQAERFVEMVGKLQQGDLPPVLDLEDDPLYQKGKTNRTATILRGGLILDDYLEAVAVWIDEVFQYFGQRPIIYTRRDFWNRATADSDRFMTYPLWVASWDQNIMREPQYLPSPWADWDFWQYRGDVVSNNKIIPGIQGKVDLDWFNGSEIQLATFAGFKFDNSI
jgi:GH25 family lysozyme M1 (1,4-beta-N-acetylmuramidase)